MAQEGDGGVVVLPASFVTELRRILLHDLNPHWEQNDSPYRWETADSRSRRRSASALGRLLDGEGQAVHRWHRVPGKPESSWLRRCAYCGLEATTNSEAYVGRCDSPDTNP